MNTIRTTTRTPIRTPIRTFILAAVVGTTISLAALLSGCSGATVGSTWEKTLDRVESQNASPNRVSLLVDGEAWDSESVVPGAYVRLYDGEMVSAESLGPKSRVFQLPWLNGQMAKVASDEDTTFEVAEITLPDGTVIKGLKLSTLASPVVKAQNEVWERYGKVVMNRDVEGAKAIMADREALTTILTTLGPSALDTLRAIAGL